MTLFLQWALFIWIGSLLIWLANRRHRSYAEADPDRWVLSSQPWFDRLANFELAAASGVLVVAAVLQVAG